MAADRNKLRSKEVSNMIKQGFIETPSIIFSPSRYISRVSSPPQTPSPPQPPHVIYPPHQLQSRTTLFEMMSNEHEKESIQSPDHDGNSAKLQQRINEILTNAPFQNPNWGEPSDVKLVVVSRDESFKVEMRLHLKILVNGSRFFADKLKSGGKIEHCVEISDIDDVEIYVETLVLMYCNDLKQRLMGENVQKVLSLLKVCSDIMFDVGVISCLKYLEAIPWTEEEEDKVVSVLCKLQTNDLVIEVLQRLYPSEPSTSTEANGVFLQVMSGVLQAKDDKACREMKNLIFKLFTVEPTSSSKGNYHLDVSKDTLDNICHRCINALVICANEVTNIDEGKRDRADLMSEISREANNLRWVVDILIDKEMGDEFVILWANLAELATLHPKIPPMRRYEISRITVQLCNAIGRGLIYASRETRFSLLCTWLEALYTDFGLMKRCCRNFDKKLVEDGLGRTILTLSLPQQQGILMNWLHRFVSKGDDCPNLRQAFEIWWRRSFIRQYAAEQQDSSKLQITSVPYCSTP
ncbi:hypothetical protein C5167_046321 [Papaver somniferum]|uniref:At3g05675-like ankyrin-like domain-containing protein n=1 Tax=Papaver somniferum TaxID=3469 RepID=A0A4Y7LDF7_PAPSO|nr:BTB/POZ domain-containing protein At5g60050-like [Papaver somniferum]RZC83533.1 hypothetical protein C5167_046321 [Papaver somniferum]